MNVIDYHRAVEVSKMRQLMKYGPDQYKEDWDLALALAFIMANGNHHHFENMLESCFQRINAYLANNPGELPFQR